VNDVAVYKSKPIADLFPETTVLFGDIVGFTAWSSVRDPTQVFTLLETVYHAFDEIAHRRRIFKVETIGDCYVGTFHRLRLISNSIILDFLRIAYLSDLFCYRSSLLQLFVDSPNRTKRTP
jgi:Adenylate and Guanylate cyclase catalytic domain